MTRLRSLCLTTKWSRSENWFASKAFSRPRDLVARGLPRAYLGRLAQEGFVERVGRGLYRSRSVVLTEQHTLAEVCRRVPQGVVCLLSALRFHDLTTQSPVEVWLALGSKARTPKTDLLPLRIVRFSAAALAAGIEERLSRACLCGSTIRPRRWWTASSTGTRSGWR